MCQKMLISADVRASELKDKRKTGIYQNRWKQREMTHAGGGNRTHTLVAKDWILSPVSPFIFEIDSPAITNMSQILLIYAEIMVLGLKGQNKVNYLIYFYINSSLNEI